MTVKLLVDWEDSRDGKKYLIGNLLTTDSGTEGGLVDARLATSTLTGGTAYVPPVLNPLDYSQPALLVADFAGKTVGIADKLGALTLSAYVTNVTSTPEEFGAVGDGTADDTYAVAKAIYAWLVRLADTKEPYTKVPGSLVLNRRYKVIGPLPIFAKAPWNLLGGKIEGTGCIVGNGGVSLSIRGMTQGWQGLSIRDLTFENAPIEAYQNGTDAAAVYGLSIKKTKHVSTNVMTLPGIHFSGIFESTIDGAVVNWVSDTASGVKIANVAGCPASSMHINHLITRGGKHGLETVGYWQGLNVGGQSTFLQAAQEGARLENAGAHISGCHFEQNCRLEGDSGLRLIGSGVVSGIDGNQQAGSGQKYLAKTYVANASNITIIGGMSYNTIPGAKIVYVDGAGAGSSVKLLGVTSKDIAPGMAPYVTDL